MVDLPDEIIKDKNKNARLAFLINKISKHQKMQRIFFSFNNELTFV